MTTAQPWLGSDRLFRLLIRKHSRISHSIFLDFSLFAPSVMAVKLSFWLGAMAAADRCNFIGLKLVLKWLVKDN
jgi:hypothetical protein